MELNTGSIINFPLSILQLIHTHYQTTHRSYWFRQYTFYPWMTIFKIRSGRQFREHGRI